ncbi:hypothetical protein ACU4GG_12405 [Streptomyces nojiriensis]
MPVHCWLLGAGLAQARCVTTPPEPSGKSSPRTMQRFGAVVS